MDKLKKTIELIGSHQTTLDHYVVDPGVKLTVKEMFDVLISEIEQLRKEKEWLLHDSAQSEYWNSDRTTLEKCRERIIMRMQLTLKEK